VIRIFGKGAHGKSLKTILHSMFKRGKRSYSTPAEKRFNTTSITSGDDFVPIADANADLTLDVGRLARSAPEE
jgi:hypothetical protein